jgi:hypothetical protein
VDRERRDVRWADDTPDGTRRAELIAALFELIAKD